ncbi:type VI secretion system-associated protein TagF [Acidisphaera sp. L21]|uniref:type VI secretion system-associated protein TagF n=1 Tax=Acidisphaera sp. L21 TaxID=1641851 RepID=UPI00131D56EA|nr:type VI secretion system-associated protein TagF [Acidisphaera sp. L21]
MSHGAVSIGFYGKLPVRGDFLRSGLPRSFVDPWDDWLQRGIAATQTREPDWVSAWLEAPIWRFLLPAGCCGDQAVLGVWMPSVDRANRYFPLTLAAVGDITAAGAFLDAAEQAGVDALAHDWEPEALAERLQNAFGPGDASDTQAADAGQAQWWTAGGARMPPRTILTHGLPESDEFPGMIDSDWVPAELNQ